MTALSGIGFRRPGLGACAVERNEWVLRRKLLGRWELEPNTESCEGFGGAIQRAAGAAPDRFTVRHPGEKLRRRHVAPPIQANTSVTVSATHAGFVCPSISITNPLTTRAAAAAVRSTFLTVCTPHTRAPTGTALGKRTRFTP